MKPIARLTVRRKPHGNPGDGLMEFEGRVFPCLLGRNGISARKREGDWKTPAGRFPLCMGYWRNDRLGRIPTALPLSPITQNLGWCDKSGDRNYNRPVKLPYAASCETMKREDRLYDVVIVMDHNYSKRARAMGSAVFFHLTADKPYTAGCVAINPKLMRHILPRLSPRTVMRILP